MHLTKKKTKNESWYIRSYFSKNINQFFLLKDKFVKIIPTFNKVNIINNFINSNNVLDGIFYFEAWVAPN